VKSAFEIADRLVDGLLSISPLLSTQLGVPGSNHRWGNDLGLEGVEERRGLRDRYRSQIAPFVDNDVHRETLAARVILGAFEEADAEYEAGDHFRDLRHMASSFHRIRSIFDVMPASTKEDRDDVVARLQTVGQPLGQYRARLEEGIARGIVVARRQVQSVVDQARRMATDPASFDAIISRFAPSGLEDAALGDAALDARAGIGEFGEWLASHYLPRAEERDAAGLEVYQRAADRLVGMAVDPDEAYRWGWEEFFRLRAEMERVAEEIRPGVGIDAVKEYLETDPEVTASGTAELVEFVERILGRAVDDLAGVHFDVPAQIRDVTVSIAAPGTPLGAYYLRPSEDFSRPGGVWYSIGEQDLFPLYQPVSTAYHEGFPGHHLQIATAMMRTKQISRFQRLLAWYPGYGEGWGMYAEVLMGELGYLDNPQHYFGMLAKQMYRASRVVVDIGLHLGKDIHESSPIEPGEPWTFETAVEFMQEYGFRTSAQARDEVLRYLGWPGQAIAYKLGEREILSIRDETRTRLGAGFDLRDFHSTVLDHGAMRLDLLRENVRGRLPR
jgi:uncharacterized protein (DUF885 family)